MDSENNVERQSSDLTRCFQSMGLIRTIVSDRMRWLVRESNCGSVYRFVAAPRLDRESFRETIRREAGWQLNLDPDRDFLVSSMAQLNMEFVDRFPGDSGLTHIAVAFYHIDIYRRPALEQVNSDARNRWISSPDVCRGHLPDGVPIDPRQTFLLRRGNLINEWD